MRTLAAAALAAFLLSAPAYAQRAPVCTDRATVMGNLAVEYSEAVTGRGITNNGWLFEIMQSSDGQTWTAIVTLPNGTTCMTAAGVAWEDLPAPVEQGPPV